MPLRAADLGHLVHCLLDAVLAEVGQPGLERLAADIGAEAFGDRHDGDHLQVTSRSLDALADRGEVGGDAHRNATIAPNRVPSGWRRWEGKREPSRVHMAA